MNIKKLRDDLILTQLELAKLVGVSKTSISLWESTDREISFKHKRKIKELCEKNNLKFENYLK